jgi:hypothetical protein
MKKVQRHRPFWKEHTIEYDRKIISSPEQFISESSIWLWDVIKTHQIKPYYIVTTKKETTDILLNTCAKTSFGELFIDRLWVFDKVMSFHRSQLNVDKHLESQNVIRYNLSFDPTHKHLTSDYETYEYLHQPVKFHDFIKEDIKEYVTPFTFRLNTKGFGGVELHPGAVRRAFLTALSDDTKIKLIICDRQNIEENKVLDAFSNKAISLFDKTPEEIADILQMNTLYSTNPNTCMSFAVCTSGTDQGLIEISQPFNTLSKKPNYVIEHTKQLVVVNSMKIAYLKDGKWLPNIGKYKIT